MRVVIADDETLLREGLERLLAEAGFEVVGKAGTADELLRRVALTWPDGTTETVAVRGGLWTTSRVLDAVGPQRVQVAVTDEDGGLGVAEETVAVRYGVVLPEGGTVNAGRAIPITFAPGPRRLRNSIT